MSLISIVGSILVSTVADIKLSVIYLTFYLLPAQMRGFEIIEKVYYKGWPQWPCAVLVTQHRGGVAIRTSQYKVYKERQRTASPPWHHQQSRLQRYSILTSIHQKEYPCGQESQFRWKLLLSVFSKYFVDISIYIEVKIGDICSPTCLNCSSKLQFCWVPKSEGLLD